MVLTVADRILLLDALPKEGNIITLKILQNLRNDLGFSEEEYRIYDFKNNENGNVIWSPDAPQEKEIQIGEKATDIIVKALRELNSHEKLTQSHLPLWEKFMGDKES